MKVFFDNNVSPHFVRALNALVRPVDSVQLTHLRDRFPTSCPDTDWIRALAAEPHWIIVSGDLRITRSKPERAAWLESGIPAFFMDDAWGNRTFWPQFVELARWWPTIVEFGRRAKPKEGWRLHFGTREPRPINSGRA